MNFKERVFQVVRRISPGETLSYREVARRAGRPAAYRAVGNVLRKNFNPAIPCHRVIRSDGSLGGYNRGPKIKRQLLRQENLQLFPL